MDHRDRLDLDDQPRGIDALTAAVLGASQVVLFENLYVAYAGEARRLAGGILEDGQLAADAVHSAYLEILRYVLGGGRWDGPSEARAVVLRNTRWAALKILRTRRRQREATLATPLADGGGDPDSWARAEARAISEQIVGRLRPPDQNVIRLHFVEGFSNPEAASHLGVSLPAFESRLRRALKAARRLARSSGLLPFRSLPLNLGPLTNSHRRPNLAAAG
jgi:RNA polymerase sigma factor (sigma-70 family)